MISQALLKQFDLNGPRYTSYPTADRFSTDVAVPELEEALAQVANTSRPTSLYVHIPFCRSLCYYCACNKVVTKSLVAADQYVDSLSQEIALVAKHTGRLRIAQLAFGGGTPNFLSLEQFARLFNSLHAHFELLGSREQSIEVDPRYLDDGYAGGLHELGFNRVSFGVQDFDERVQKLIHRFQSFEQTARAVREFRAAGFESVSFDLVYGLPIQSRESFAETLERTLLLDPERVALFNYAHIPERFKAQRRIPNEALPTIDQRVELFLYARERLVDAGYVAIGLDHFAKPSDALAAAFKSGSLRRNFQGYSTHQGTQLIGLGASAISQLDSCYTQNAPQLDAYYARLADGRLPTYRGISLTRDDRIRARVIESIMCEGRVMWAAIEQEFVISAQHYFTNEIRSLEKMQDSGVVNISGDTFHVSEPGRLLLRAVAMIFDAHRARPLQQVASESVHPVRFSSIA